MKALFSYAPFDNRLQEVEIPKPGPEELLVAMRLGDTPVPIPNTKVKT